MSFLPVDTLEKKENVPEFNGRFLHTTTRTLANWDIKAGSVLPVQPHPRRLPIAIFKV